MQLTHPKLLGQKHLRPTLAPRARSRQAAAARCIIYINMYPIAQHTPQALPPHAQRTALIHSCFHQPHPRHPPLRKPQPSKIHPAAAIRAIRPQFRRASLRAIRIIRRSKTRVVLPQKHIPLRQPRRTRRLTQPHTQHPRRLRRKPYHRLEPPPLLQLRL
ncbi:MAG: hypothetical protein SPL12_03575 [Bacteroidales bacterium]|nr:hypothetical protein [Bacteroidales bacterium]